MRKLPITLLLTGFAGNASAHTIAGPSSDGLQLAHQLASPHHAGLAMLALIAAAIVFFAMIRIGQRKN